jgi:hypothetical protein
LAHFQDAKELLQEEMFVGIVSHCTEETMKIFVPDSLSLSWVSNPGAFEYGAEYESLEPEASREMMIFFSCL